MSARGYERFDLVQPKSRGRIGGRLGVRVGAVQDILRYGGPALAAGLAANSGGFLRNFVHANPPFASTAVHNSLRMARIRSRTRVTRRTRRRFRKGGKARRRRTYRRRRAVCRPVITRVSKELDGSVEVGKRGYINVLNNRGGIYKFIGRTTLLPDLSKEFGKQYTHFKILRWTLTYVPETTAPPTLDEAADNSERSIPACFKSYHMGADIPRDIYTMGASQGMIPMDPLKKHKFVWVPKYIQKLTTAVTIEGRPKNMWLPISVAEVSCMNGPLISWTNYCMPNDKCAAPIKSIRIKLVAKATIRLAKFKTYSGSVGSSIADNFHKPKMSHIVGNIVKF